MMFNKDDSSKMTYEYKDYPNDYDNWFRETHKRVSYGQLRWMRFGWFCLGAFSMFAILFVTGWLLGL